ncbi:MAG: glutamine-hydrolyzing GMP synthase [Saprospiraceae bacterium]|nr:glutamine-hydrolyzing GMP synthase [Saprospiraceae bacterium]MCF8248330.1 glutamine-hydrolyzing GMP synthase [Saprospiraceae bacterium]MCF8280231.1 glutamine-hydrolyzing GMP synthase [Bacteroidales bacterium]MCF8309858.1 glutamine-hydrolyzing GMP synthase [Saprospiraceae bacterium]MCF8438811.1 glutamine-hydrolyzing GMP synthase [Saprospiraceae bacterium]
MTEKILILDFGSQYTQLIARRVRELNTYCEIVPYNKLPTLDASVKGIILSGSPFSVRQEDALRLDLNTVVGQRPVLAICYGAQLIADQLGGQVDRSEKREYGKAALTKIHSNGALLKGVPTDSQVWMSHADTIVELPEQFELMASTASVEVAAFKAKEGAFAAPVYCIQFHPEVTHSLDGLSILRNFVHEIAGCKGDWTPTHFIEEKIVELRKTIGNERVLMGLSGGVDSTVAAELLHKAIGDRLVCFFVDNGLLRKNEYQEVLDSYKVMGLNVFGIDAKQRFYDELAGATDPEKKRKIIGRVFIEVFQDEAHKLKEDIAWLGQGTIYPDVIESVSVHGPSVTIKSHHNVGGLPDLLKLKIVEPLRSLFKDEVRRVGKELGIPTDILGRHPFPGPGLGVRILGDITPEKVALLQEADAIFTKNLKKFGLYDEVWQAGTMLLPIQSVGVMGDERTYEQPVVLRAVNSTDGMTAEWSRLPHEFLAVVSNEIVNNVKGINRVVYDISTKPPATIEWE